MDGGTAMRRHSRVGSGPAAVPQHRQASAHRARPGAAEVAAGVERDDLVQVQGPPPAGALLKTAPSHELLQAVHAVAAGTTALEPSVSAALARRWTRADGPGGTQLSARELEVLRLTSHGMANKEIAHKLGLSLRTIEGHLNRTFNKLGVASRTEAVFHAVNHRLISLEAEAS
jgi:DNA-binding NarL/FixJ family response regulator